MLAHNSTANSCSRSTKIGKEVVIDIPHQLQSQKVKGQDQQAALGGCSSHHLQGMGNVVAASQLIDCSVPVIRTVSYVIENNWGQNFGGEYPVPDTKSRMGGHSKLKFVKNEDHDMGDPRSHLEVERSKVKVTEEEIDELQILYDDLRTCQILHKLTERDSWRLRT